MCKHCTNQFWCHQLLPYHNRNPRLFCELCSFLGSHIHPIFGSPSTTKKCSAYISCFLLITFLLFVRTFLNSIPQNTGNFSIAYNLGIQPSNKINLFPRWKAQRLAWRAYWIWGNAMRKAQQLPFLWKAEQSCTYRYSPHHVPPLKISLPLHWMSFTKRRNTALLT